MKNEVNKTSTEIIKNLEKQVAELNLELQETKKQLIDAAVRDIAIRNMSLQDNEVSIQLEGSVFHLFADAFLHVFENNGAVNYLIARFSHEEGDFDVTMQKVDGSTPLDKLGENQLELTRLRQTIESRSGYQISDQNQIVKRRYPEDEPGNDVYDCFTNVGIQYWDNGVWLTPVEEGPWEPDYHNEVSWYIDLSALKAK